MYSLLVGYNIVYDHEHDVPAAQVQHRVLQGHPHTIPLVVDIFCKFFALTKISLIKVTVAMINVTVTTTMGIVEARVKGVERLVQNQILKLNSHSIVLAVTRSEEHWRMRSMVDSPLWTLYTTLSVVEALANKVSTGII